MNFSSYSRSAFHIFSEFFYDNSNLQKVLSPDYCIDSNTQLLSEPFSSTLFSTLPRGYCGRRSCTPSWRTPPSARLVGAVQQGELSQLLLSDLVVVVLRETKYSMSQKQGHLSSDCNRCSQQQQMSSDQNDLDTHRKHMASLSVEYSMKNVFFWLCLDTKCRGESSISTM